VSASPRVKAHRGRVVVGKDRGAHLTLDRWFAPQRGLLTTTCNGGEDCDVGRTCRGFGSQRRNSSASLSVTAQRYRRLGLRSRTAQQKLDDPNPLRSGSAARVPCPARAAQPRSAAHLPPADIPRVVTHLQTSRATPSTAPARSVHCRPASNSAYKQKRFAIRVPACLEDKPAPCRSFDALSRSPKSNTDQTNIDLRPAGFILEARPIADRQPRAPNVR
jgi:hypothetical protein